MAEDGASLALDDAAYLRVLGDRVRARRQACGLSRRALAERSDVSERFQAELEAGRGNISIARLRRLARALDAPLSDLVCEASAPAGLSEDELLQRIASAPTDVRSQVMALLAPAGAARRRRIALIGLRGAGKSTLGAEAGAQLGMPFQELNAAIRQLSGMGLDDVFALQAPPGIGGLSVRRWKGVVEAHDKIIVAVGGGIVSDQQTYGFLLEHFHTIWLTATPEEHLARVRNQGDVRPMAGDPAPMAALTRILEARQPLYDRAAARVDTSGASPKDSLAALVAAITRLAPPTI